MSNMKDGGPAFPCAQNVMKADEGMSLRDWFAGQALAGLVADQHTRIVNIPEVAWRLADAMLAARQVVPAAETQREQGDPNKRA
jgi:hypothetical protein